MSQSNPEFRERDASRAAMERLIVQGTTPLMARILASRGVEDIDDMNLGLNKMLPVASLTNAYKMAEILADAIRDKKKILIVADYDCDGATACTISYRALKAFGAVVDYFVPNRFIDGYGLTDDLVRKFEHRKPAYVFTVDNGITSVEGVKYANSVGIGVLVTDHHLPGPVLPDATCIVNPNHPDCTFKSKNLAGCGVAWYVMAALQKTLEARSGKAPDFDVRSLLDLVAVGTVADVVKLDMNNRCLVSTGLRQIREGRTLPMIAALVDVKDRDLATLSTTDIGFSIGPLINAAGRLDDASMAINGLLSDDMEVSMACAKDLNKINVERKEKENEAKDEAEIMAANIAITDPDRYTMVFEADSWHEGVVGIVASRIKDRTNRPTFILTRGDRGGYKGSGRSIGTLNLKKCLDMIQLYHPDVFMKYGGHAMAAGVTIHDGKVEEFKQAFEEVARKMLTPEMLKEVVDTDGPLTDADITIEFSDYLRDQVWGNGFPPPLFEGVFKIVGQQVFAEKHMRLELEQGGKKYGGVCFFRTEPFAEETRLAYTLDVNNFRGDKKIQIMIQKTLEDPVPEIKVGHVEEVHKTSDGFCF